MTWINSPSEPTSALELQVLNSSVLPSVPMEGWPTCFSPPRLSEDRSHYEVLLTSSAAEEMPKTWKFYFPDKSSDVIDITWRLKQLSPFLWDANLLEDLDTLQECAANMWIIADGFTDHRDRRNFFDKHDDASRYCKKFSRLRKNSMGYLGQAVASINKNLVQPIETELTDLSSVLKDYDKIDFQWKVTLVTQVDDMILTYLRAIHTQITQQ